MTNNLSNPEKIKKIKNIVCALVGVAVIIVGIITICASDSHTGHSGGVSRASTSIEFGADFYTTSAEYTGLAANSVVDTFELLQNCFGIAFIVAGILIACHFACEYMCCMASTEKKALEVILEDTFEASDESTLNATE